MEIETRCPSPTQFQGQPWSAWIDKTGRTSPEVKAEDLALKASLKKQSSVMRLSKSDMGLYGLCFARKSFSLVICKQCSAAVTMQGLKNHIDLRHSNPDAVDTKLSVIQPAIQPVAKKKSKVKVLKPLVKNAKSKKSFPVVLAEADSTTTPVLLAEADSTSIKPGLNTDSVTSAHTKSSAAAVNAACVEIAPTPLAVPPTPPPTPTFLTPPTPPPPPPPQPSLPPIVLQLKSDSNGSPTIMSLSPQQPLPSAYEREGQQQVPVVELVATDVTLQSPQQVVPVLQISVDSPSFLNPSPSPHTDNAPVTKSRQNVRKMKGKVFDVDKHCGVFTEDMKHCTRSLTCRRHSAVLKRLIEGRSKSFDQLLADHKAAKDVFNKQKKTVETINVNPTVNGIHPTSTPTLQTLQPIANENTNTVHVPEMGIRLPILIVNQTEKMVVLPDPPVNVAPQFTSPKTPFINNVPEQTEDSIPNSILTDGDLTFSRSSAKPLTVGLFSAVKIGGLYYTNRKLQMARHCLERLDNIENLY